MESPSSKQCPFNRSAPSDTARARTAGTWPPGPWAGLTGRRLLAEMSRDLPGALAAWQAEYGDLVHLRLWHEHEIVVTDPALARELLVTHPDALVRWERGVRIFSQVHGQSVLTTEGETWRARRQALSPDFSPKAVQRLTQTIVDATSQAFAQWPAEAGDWPIESALTLLAMDVILRMVFSSCLGEDVHVAEQAIRVIGAATNAEFFSAVSLPDWMPWKRTKRRALNSLKGLIERHLQGRLGLARDAWPDDLLSRLLRLREDGAALSLQDVRDECMTSFLAGHETTAAALGWWAWCMASNPAAQRHAREEVQHVLRGDTPTIEALPSLEYVGHTIKESLRLYPAVPVLFSRRAQGVVQLGDWTFPARTLFVVPVNVIHRDSRWYTDPEAFQPERFATGAPEIPRGAYMPFGAGARVCLGQHLAMTEMTIIAAMLLQRFELSVPSGSTPPRAVLNVTLRPDEPMLLRVAPVGAAVA
ncbi:cytochrome P450 [Paraburkholderia tropica]|uniref:cytochrome P450 n=1 Tax=Paraburkholderia tropica TaxID=92647 RepID=UPI0007EC9975|nr:cytochrome P450 [Paraburkholderia tropica]OBR48036.1 cytochrome P450 [Paraburkholderia tropica]